MEELKAGDRIKHNVRGKGTIYYINNKEGFAYITYDNIFKDNYGVKCKNEIADINDLTKI